MASRLKLLFCVCFVALVIAVLLSRGRFKPELYQPPPIVRSSTAVPALTITEPDESLSETQAKIFRLNVSEEAVLQLTPLLKQIAQGLEDGSEQSHDLFSANCQLNGPRKNGVNLKLSLANARASKLFQKLQWPLDDGGPMNDARLIWPSVLAQATCEDTQFGVISGNLLRGGSTFRMKTSFEGKLVPKDKLDSPAAFGVKATQVLDFQRTNDDRWKIAKWEQIKFEIQIAGGHLFSDVTESVIAEPSTFAAIKEARILDLLKQELRGEEFPLKSDKMFQLFHDWHSSAQYNSVSVVDFDSDQWDDLFLTNNLGRTLLLRNRQDGTFEDVSSQSGLQHNRAFTNCALFADFDNDGDQDVLLGRNFEPCLFYVNENGTFTLDFETNQELQDCKLISAGSVVDINNDGLLDVYLGTYSQNLGASQEWMNYAVPERHWELLRERCKFRHSYLDRAGPPNIVLINVNGKLKRLEPEAPLAQWRNSFQSVWIDFDSDGDQDVYLCNDFAPDVLLQNQTEKRSQHLSFKDVTEATFGSGVMGFGMGACVGDYNNDGLLDIYVSNMYSKAGNRVFEQLEGDVHPSLKVAAAGNFMYRNTGDGKFSQEAGAAEDDQHVAKVGWSYGGQMTDFNNDGQLDIYVPSGLFTPPDNVDAQEDL